MKELKKLVSINETIRRLLKIRKSRPSQFAGGWRMDENEVEEIKTLNSFLILVMRRLRRFGSHIWSKTQATMLLVTSIPRASYIPLPEGVPFISNI